MQKPSVAAKSSPPVDLKFNQLSSAQERKGAGVAANEVNENSDRELSCT
jgi:hypothetical protein